MNLRRALAIMLIVFSRCAGASIESELNRESQINGLALAGVVGQHTIVIPFGDAPRYYKTKWGVAVPTFTKSGRVVAWKVQAFMRPPKLIIETVEGKQLANHSFSSDFNVLSFDETCNRIALLIQSERNAPMAFDLRWQSLNSSTNEIMDGSKITDSASSADWSPDCRFLIYERDTDIYIFDTRDRTTTLIQRGHDPAWSPNGRTIVFRALVGGIALMNTKGDIVSSPLEKHVPLGPVRWSPDGKYVSFAEKETSPIPISFFSATARLAVCRVQDGSCITAREFGSINAYYNVFHWVVGYKDFCRTCEQAEPLN